MPPTEQPGDLSVILIAAFRVGGAHISPITSAPSLGNPNVLSRGSGVWGRALRDPQTARARAARKDHTRYSCAGLSMCGCLHTSSYRNIRSTHTLGSRGPTVWRVPLCCLFGPYGRLSALNGRPSGTKHCGPSSKTGPQCGLRGSRAKRDPVIMSHAVRSLRDCLH